MKGRTIADYHETRANCFNCIRLLAAAYVVYSHSFHLTRTNDPLAPFIFNFPSFTAHGVVAFFLISGFLITESFFRRHDPLLFFKCRFLRIGPGLLACLLFCAFIVGPIVTTHRIGAYFTDPRVYTYLLRNLGFPFHAFSQNLPGVFADNPRSASVNGSLWTLSPEVRCYGVILLLGVLGVFRRKALRVTYLILCGLAAAGSSFADTGFSIAGHSVAGSQTQFLWIAFFTGSAIYFLRSYVVLNGWILTGIIVLSFLAWKIHRGAFAPAVLICFAYAIFFCAYRFPKLGSFVTRHGDFSYGLYIYAFPVQQTVAYLWKGIGGWGEFIISLPVALTLGWLSWLLIEKPALGLKDRPLTLPWKWGRAQHTGPQTIETEPSTKH